MEEGSENSSSVKARLWQIVNVQTQKMRYITTTIWIVPTAYVASSWKEIYTFHVDFDTHIKYVRMYVHIHLYIHTWDYT